MLLARVSSFRISFFLFLNVKDMEQRRPFETLLLCWSAATDAPWERIKESSGPSDSISNAGGSLFLRPEDGLVVAAMPSQHSRKPPLGPLLQQLLPEGARCLEVRERKIRYSLPSTGNDCL
jgi:hypothetical protein